MTDSRGPDASQAWIRMRPKTASRGMPGVIGFALALLQRLAVEVGVVASSMPSSMAASSPWVTSARDLRSGSHLYRHTHRVDGEP